MAYCHACGQELPPEFIVKSKKGIYEFHRDDLLCYEDILPDDPDSHLLVYFKHREYTYFPKQTERVEGLYQEALAQAEDNDEDIPTFDNEADAIEYFLYSHPDVEEVFPLYMYDHSGLAFSTEGFERIDSAGWDWDQVGFIVVLKGRGFENVKDAVINLVSTINAVERGDVYYAKLRGTPVGLAEIVMPDSREREDVVRDTLQYFGDTTNFKIYDPDEFQALDQQGSSG